VDTLANVNAKDGITVTTGPASIDPETGKPYGMRFPQVQILDSVNVQKALLESLGVKKLHAIVGASMGSMQGFEWAATYPEMVDRLVAVVPCASADAMTLARLRDVIAAIMLDPKWKQGEYYGQERPLDGVMLAGRMVMWLSLARPACDLHGRRWADPGKDPALEMGNTYAINLYLGSLAAASAQVVDANSLIYTTRAIELFSVGGEDSLEAGLSRIKAKVLLIPSKSDNLFPPEHSQKLKHLLQSQGGEVEYFELIGPFGHLDGAYSIAQASDVIHGFLNG
jgi:homoserine O-acetyltransferase